MVTREKLGENLNILRQIIPLKPKEYTSEYPLSLKDCLTKYCNQRTVHLVQIGTKQLNEKNWPLPLWVNPKKIRFGFINLIYFRKFHNSFGGKKFKGLKDFDYLYSPQFNDLFFKRNYDATLIEAFGANKKYVKQKFLSNPLLKSKIGIIEEIFKAYNRQYWFSCISTILPLLDFVARKLLNTTDLKIDIKKICKLFEQNGFSLENLGYLMPIVTMVEAYSHEKKMSAAEREIISERVKDNNFSLIGPALSSFLHFANHYYSYYKEDNGDVNIINSHAILHGSMNSFGNKANVVKLFTFLFLLLELEPVFVILLKED